MISTNNIFYVRWRIKATFEVFIEKFQSFLTEERKQFADSPQPWQFGFQDPASPTMEAIIDLHNDIMAIMMFILFFVLWMLAVASLSYLETSNRIPTKFTHGIAVEIAWTVAPSFILIAIAIPSFSLLYSSDELNDPAMTLKVIGRQWYWSYEYSDYADSDEALSSLIVYDSYMIAEDDLELGQLRLLEVDNRVVLPVHTHIRILLTAADVLHSWAIPSLGVKCDCVPGRLNQVALYINREGVFYGQCSELCGANHGFMPIVVESCSTDAYVSWLTETIKSA